ncbi:MAG: hypothetical protein HQK94_09090 [Nitrospirae bacterium]|nr:hypothetical protein [Nitrospirota bacterium]
MSKLLVGVFVSVFVGALLVEILQRQEPEMMDKIKNKFWDKVNRILEPSVVVEK